MPWIFQCGAKWSSASDSTSSTVRGGANLAVARRGIALSYEQRRSEYHTRRGAHGMGGRANDLAWSHMAFPDAAAGGHIPAGRPTADVQTKYTTTYHTHLRTRAHAPRASSQSMHEIPLGGPHYSQGSPPHLNHSTAKEAHSIISAHHAYTPD
eukprot:7269755-Prymnesium_polylepis.2